MRRSASILLIGIAASAAAPGAHAAGVRSPDLWATVNVCDTLRNPNWIGIRASMPGSPYPNERMYMRFRVQYYRSSDELWHNLVKGGNSGFRYVGPARYKARQSGWGFQFAPPAGGRFLMRGKVTFQWRRHGRVMRTAARVTEAGHTSTVGSDPPGYSSDTCVIS